MAKHKTVKTEATSKKSTHAGTQAETLEAAVREGAEAVVERVEAAAEQVETAAQQAETLVEKAAERAETLVGRAAEKAETLVEKAAGVVVEKAGAAAERAEAVVDKAQAASETAAEAVKAQASRTEAGVTEAAQQVVSFVKEHLEQAQRQFGQLEVEAQKALTTLVLRSRESGREVLERPAVKELRKKATWVEGEVRQRLMGLRYRMVEVVGGVASQSQVDAINRELDRLTRKLDDLVAAPPAEQPRQDSPKA